MIDFNYNDDGIILDHKVDLVLEQLDMLLSTHKCAVLGDPDYGQDFEKFLYELNQTNASIQEYITKTVVNNIDLMGMDLEVSVEILEGTIRDIILVNIILMHNGMMYNRVFKIE